jgi:excisionase family DNA binding protein
MKAQPEWLLTVEEAAEMFNTRVRFVRRLIAERRISYTHLGRHVRIPESAVQALIQAGMVEPVTRPQLKRIALWRESDALAVSADCLPAAGRHGTRDLTALTTRHLTRSRPRLMPNGGCLSPKRTSSKTTD